MTSTARAKKKVLVVDDSPVARMMAVTLLKRHPVEVITANNGAEAVTKASAELPDLILMDLMMPEMNGFEAVRVLRSREPTEKIPIVMVTSKGEEDRVQAGYAAGATDYVTKPIDAMILATKIRALLDPSGPGPT
jgi:twitching motility two-component system response regulator PilH